MKTLVENTPEIEFYTLLKDWLPLIGPVDGYDFALAEVQLNYGAFLFTGWKPERGDIQYWIPGTELVDLLRNDDLQFLWGTFAAIPSSLSVFDPDGQGRAVCGAGQGGVAGAYIRQNGEAAGDGRSSDGDVRILNQ